MKIAILFWLAYALCACTMAPKYIRPKATVPLTKTEKIDNEPQKEIAAISWNQYFRSSDLQRVIKLALEKNKDLQIAMLNIEAAEDAHGIARSNLLPAITGTAYQTRQGVPSAFASFTPRQQVRANIGFTAYEIDIFGRLRSLKKAALEAFLASKEAKNVVEISVIAQTANAYSQLLLDQNLLQIAKENAEAQLQISQYVLARYQNQIDSQLDLLDAQAQLEKAKILVASYQKIVEQDKNALMSLTGVFDENSLPKINEIEEIKIDESVLEMVPSQNLLLRPDIKEAEHNLKSANANIGAARAAFFPSITLTGNKGYASAQLKTLTDSQVWSFSPQINLPIFSGGRNIANLDLAHIRKKIEIINYEKAIQTAFTEASNEIAARESLLNQLSSNKKIFEAKQKSFDLAKAKHKNGIYSNLEVASSKVNYLAAKQDFLTNQKEVVANLISLYKVMGGGAKKEDQK